MIHATLEALLALRDGEGADATRRHVDGCEQCAAELERLYQVQARLRAMPVRRPPRDRWVDVRNAVMRERQRARWVKTSWIGLAAAAMVTLLVTGPRLFETREALRAEAVFESQISDLREQSQLLDAELRAYAPQQRVMSGWMAETVIELEDGISLVDNELARAVAERRSPVEMLNLWRQRIELQGALVNVQVVRVPARGF